MPRAVLCRRVQGLVRGLVRGLGPLALAACAAAGQGPGERDDAVAPAPVPVALRLVITGAAEPVFAPDRPIPVALSRGGAEAPATLEVRAGALSVAQLPPGRYAVTRIGPLACAGIGFDLGPGPAPQALGTLRAEVLRTEYDVALISAAPATPADLAVLGGGAEAAPLTVHRQALCHSGRGGAGTQFRDLSPAEQVMAGILFAGFCAAAVASGGFCAF